MGEGAWVASSNRPERSACCMPGRRSGSLLGNLFFAGSHMALEIELSVLSTTPAQIEYLRRCLVEFEARSRIRVNLQILDWATGRSELIKMGLYRHGADVSDVGSTWIGDFFAMNALRPFAFNEVAALGGEKAFVPAAWQAGVPLGGSQVWAIPWIVSPILIVYRKDLLRQAEVDERTAFQTYAQLEQTLKRLKASGWEMLLALPVRSSRYSTLHNVSSWIWGAGGDILSPDGKRVLFDQPKALRAMRMYYGLHRYFPPALFQSDKPINPRVFWQGQAAVAVGGSWLAGTTASMLPEVSRHLGVSRLPGTSFVGAQSLVVWQHSRHPAAAVELVNYLVQPSVQAEYARALNLMPSSVELLSAPPYADDPSGKIMAQAALSGRAFPTISLLGLVEDKLSLALEQIWDDVLANPDGELESIIYNRIEPLARQLNLTLQS